MIAWREESLWGTRAVARSGIFVLLLSTCIRECLATSIRVSLLILASAVGVTVCRQHFELTGWTLSSKNQRVLFETCVALLSLAGMFRYLWFAYFDIQNIATTRTAHQEQIRLVHRGVLSFRPCLFLSLPMTFVSAGLSSKFAKRITFVNLIFFVGFAAKVFQNAQRASAVSTPEVGSALLLNYWDDLWFQLCAVAGTVFFSCVSCAEEDADLVALLQAGREADSILNHTIKNSIAGAVCLLEVEVQDLTTPLESRRQLQQTLEQLYRSMHWCASRQVLMDLTSGKYESAFTHVHATKFLRSVASTLTLATFSVSSDVDHVAFDEKMARIALDNAATNAVAHGDNGHVSFAATFVRDNGSSEKDGLIIFTVENQLPFGSTTTNLELKAAQERAILMSTSGRTGPSPSPHAVAAKPAGYLMKKSYNSTNSGLRHIHAACQGAGGFFNLCVGDSSDPQSNTVVTTIAFPAQELTPSGPAPPTTSSAQQQQQASAVRTEGSQGGGGGSGSGSGRSIGCSPPAGTPLSTRKPPAVFALQTGTSDSMSPPSSFSPNGTPEVRSHRRSREVLEPSDSFPLSSYDATALSSMRNFRRSCEVPSPAPSASALRFFGSESRSSDSESSSRVSSDAGGSKFFSCSSRSSSQSASITPTELRAPEIGARRFRLDAASTTAAAHPGETTTLRRQSWAPAGTPPRRAEEASKAVGDPASGAPAAAAAAACAAPNDNGEASLTSSWKKSLLTLNVAFMEEEESDEARDPLKICAIDDSPLICKGYTRLLLPQMNANEELSLISCPSTEGDVDAFVETVVGSGQVPAADVVLLDQNIELQQGGLVLGTDLVKKLRSLGFSGLVLIRSASSGADDRNLSDASGTVDAFIGKTGSMKELVVEIKEALKSKASATNT